MSTLHGVVFDICDSTAEPQPIGCRQTAGPSASHPVPRRLPAVRSDSAAPRRAPAAADGSRRRMATAPAASAPVMRRLRVGRRRRRIGRRGRADLRRRLHQVRERVAGLRLRQARDRHALMGGPHEAGPDFHRQAAAGRLLGRRVVVIAEPDAGDEVRGVADEPGVAVILAGAGLAGGGPARNFGLARGA